MIDKVYAKQKMNLLKIRDFSQAFSDTFKFIKLNGKSLFLSVLIYGGIFSLILGVAYGLFMSKYFDLIGNVSGGDPFDESSIETIAYYGAVILVAMVVGVLAFYSFTGLNYKAVIEYEKMGADEELTMNTIWRSTKKDFARILGGMFLLTFFLTISITIVVGVFALMAGGLATINEGLMVIPMLMAFLMIFVGVAYLGTCLSPFWMVYLRERLGFFDSIKRCFQLIKGNFWSTFLVLFVMQLLTSIASYIFQIPVLIYMMIKMVMGFDDNMTDPGDMLNFNEFIMGLLYAFSFFGRYLMLSIVLVATSIIYYNLVERNEGEDISKRIDNMGVDLSKY